jgi:hypothetical protein
LVYFLLCFCFSIIISFSKCCLHLLRSLSYSCIWMYVVKNHGLSPFNYLVKLSTLLSSFGPLLLISKFLLINHFIFLLSACICNRSHLISFLSASYLFQRCFFPHSTVILYLSSNCSCLFYVCS